MSSYQYYIHVSVPTLSPTLFFKIIHRVIFLKDLTPKHQVLESKPLITKENYQSVPKLIEDRRNRTRTWVQWTKIFASTPNLGFS